jgi:hypothetical protein
MGWPEYTKPPGAGTIPSRRGSAYLAGGGSWLGIHGASTTEYEWPWFGGAVGARFVKHPPVQAATVTVEYGEHPVTSHLPSLWRGALHPTASQAGAGLVPEHDHGAF